MARTKTREAAAKQLNVSGETLRKWQYAAWWKAEFHTKAGYDIAAIKAANPRYTDEEATKDAVDESRKMSLMARKIDLQIRMSKLKERDRELLPVDQIIEITTQHSKALVNTLTNLPGMLSRLVTDRKLRKKLNDEGQTIVRNILRTYSHDMEASLQRLIDE